MTEEELAPVERALERAPRRSLAVFDLDGTLARGHMITDFPSHLRKAGLFPAGALAAVEKLKADLVSGKASYRRVAEQLPRLYARGVRGRRAEDVAREAKKFVEAREGAVHPFSRGLVGLLRGTGRPAVALSGSPEDTVGALARRLGMDAAFGTRLRVRDGTFTGRVDRNFILLENKRSFFDRLSAELALDLRDCFGFGDTEQDLSFLERVGHPVCLDPSPALRAVALQRGWPALPLGSEILSEVRGMLEG